MKTNVKKRQAKKPVANPEKDRFENVAKRLECDEDKDRFEKNLGKIAKATQQPVKGKRQQPKN